MCQQTAGLHGYHYIMRKLCVFGSQGMVGAAICKVLSKKSHLEIIPVSREKVDLYNQAEVNNYIKSVGADEIILAAGKVGGIVANNEYPAEFIYGNLQIQNNVIHAAHLNDVQKLLFISSSSIYPVSAEQPLCENALLTGVLERTHEPYAIAKIAGIKMCESYNRQYGRDYRAVVPSNLYGPGDNYRVSDNHVVPALIHRFHQAKENRLDKVVVWGSGTPKRELLYVDDMAEASVFIHELKLQCLHENTQPMQSHINVGTGTDITIKKLAETIKEVVGFNGDLEFDKTKPDGAPRKIMDVSLISKLGWKAKVSLKSGLERSYLDFLSFNT